MRTSAAPPRAVTTVTCTGPPCGAYSPRHLTRRITPTHEKIAPTHESKTTIAASKSLESLTLRWSLIDRSTTNAAFDYVLRLSPCTILVRALSLRRPVQRIWRAHGMRPPHLMLLAERCRDRVRRACQVPPAQTRRVSLRRRPAGSRDAIRLESRPQAIVASAKRAACRAGGRHGWRHR